MTADPDVPPEGEESGLMSDSAYEVITNTDTESQDDFPAGSVCSSDYLHGDDVQSLVSTEYTGEDRDDGQSDASEGVVLPGQVQAPTEQDEAEADDTHSDYEEEHIEESSAPQKSQELASIATSATLPQKPSDDENSRKSALQYAEESLGTPSASIHADMEEREKENALLAELHSLMDRHMGSVFTAASMVGFLLVFTFTCFIVRSCLTPTARPDAIMPAPPAEVQTTVSVTTSTMIINHTSTKTVLLSETRTAAPPAATTETLLLPSSQAQRAPEKPEEKGICSAEVHSAQEILLRMPHNTKLYWLAKDSISIELARGEETIKAKFSSVDEGILIEVPGSEARGVVNVSVTTTRRPKVNETFAVDFGKGVVEEMADLGRMFVRDFKGYFAVASAESARRAEEMKTAASEALRALEKPISAAGEEAKRVWRTYDLDLDLPSGFIPGVQEQASRLLQRFDRRAREVEDELQLSLLRARIGAKALWLRLRGDERAHNLFVGRAEVYVKEKAAEAGVRRVRRDVETREGRACMVWGGRRVCLD